MKRKFWWVLVIALLTSPLAAHATLIGTFTGTWADDADSAPYRNFGTLDMVFSTATATPGGLDVSGLLSLVCTGGEDPDLDCGASATFSGTFANATHQLMLTFAGVVDIKATVSTDFNSIAGTYASVSEGVHGTFRAARTSVSVPEPSALALLCAGLLGAVATRRRLAASRVVARPCGADCRRS